MYNITSCKMRGVVTFEGHCKLVQLLQSSQGKTAFEMIANSLVVPTLCFDNWMYGYRGNTVGQRIGRMDEADDSGRRGLGFDSRESLKLFSPIFDGCHD